METGTFLSSKAYINKRNGASPTKPRPAWSASIHVLLAARESIRAWTFNRTDRSPSPPLPPRILRRRPPRQPQQEHHRHLLQELPRRRPREPLQAFLCLRKGPPRGPSLRARTGASAPDRNRLRRQLQGSNPSFQHRVSTRIATEGTCIASSSTEKLPCSASSMARGLSPAPRMDSRSLAVGAAFPPRTA